MTSVFLKKDSLGQSFFVKEVFLKGFVFIRNYLSKQAIFCKQLFQEDSVPELPEIPALQHLAKVKINLTKFNCCENKIIQKKSHRIFI